MPSLAGNVKSGGKLRQMWDDLLPGSETLKEEGMAVGVEPAEGGLEVFGIESGAASGGLVAIGSEVEEDA